MIIPNPWLTNLLQHKIRSLIFGSTQVHRIVHFLFPVFPEATVDTEIVILRRAPLQGWQTKVLVVDKPESISGGNSTFATLTHNQDKWASSNGKVVNIFLTEEEEQLAKMLEKRLKSAEGK